MSGKRPCSPCSGSMRPWRCEAIDGFVTKGGPEDKKIYLAVTPYLDGGTNFPFLERLIGDADERVRQAAIRVIGNFVEDERYLSLFETVLKSGDVPNEVLNGDRREAD